MDIGVKFCGGCNPSYNRTNALEIIKERLKSMNFIYADENTIFDAVIVINGCFSMCADKSRLKYKKCIFEIAAFSEIEALCLKLKNL